jgi:hypothetical protein
MTTLPDADAWIDSDARFWGKAGMHLVLPTVIECPASVCGALNIIDASTAPH